MKKFSFALMTAAAVLATSCSNDIDPIANDGNGNVTFSISIPGAVNTRAYGDGTTATQLRYVVYEAGSNTAIINETKSFDNGLSTTLSLNLLNGKDYDILFWADTPDSGHSFDATTKTVTVNYGAICDEKQDAFYAKYNTGVINGGIVKNITLTRPFAQINFGTNDLETAELKRVFGDNLENLYTSLSATAYSTLNLDNGSVDGEQTVSFAPAKILTGADREFAVDDYDRVQVAYLLVPAESSLTDLKFYTHVGNAAALPAPVAVSNVPVQANYRTNIYGSLFISPVDLTVTKVPGFIEPGFDPVFVVTDANQLPGLLSSVSDGDEIKIGGDIDLTSLGDNLVVDKDLTFVVGPGVTVTTARTNNVANILVAEGKTLTVTGGGSFEGDNRIIDVDGTLIVDGVNFKTTTTNKGSILCAYGDGQIIIENGTLDAGMAGIWLEDNSKCHIKDGYFTSESSNNPALGGWSYYLRGVGDNTEYIIDGGEFYAIQGIVSPSGGKVTINGGSFIVHNEEGRTNGFYAVYATVASEITINGGYFYGPNIRTSLDIEGTSCVVSGDNDTNKPFGNLYITGGYFSGKAYKYPGNTLIEPQDGYEYQPVDMKAFGVPFCWTVAKK